MASNKKINHFLDIDDFDSTTLKNILAVANLLKSDGGKSGYKPLEGYKIALIFEKPSTRTRVSFEAGMKELGGDVIVLNSSELQLGRGETVADTARVLSRYVDVLMIRCFKHKTVEEFAKYASVPVINGLTNFSHPCQIMADIMTFEEHKGAIKNKVITWLGDSNNVSNSWIHAAVVLGFDFRIASPKGMEPDKDILDWAEDEENKITVTEDIRDALKGADAVVTDSWLSMGQEEKLSKKERKEKLKILRDYQVNEKLMEKAKKDAIFMHCLPAHRGEEVTDDVIDGHQSVVWDEAENRLHVQKAIILWSVAPRKFEALLESGFAGNKIRSIK